MGDVLTAQPPGRAAPVPVRLSWAPSRLNTARSPETLGPSIYIGPTTGSSSEDPYTSITWIEQGSIDFPL